MADGVMHSTARSHARFPAARPPAPRPPRIGTLAHQATEWLRAHPEEELSIADMEAKFGRPALDGDHTRLSAAFALGLLSREKLPARGNPWIYRAGPA